jgi:hypothetical protein
MDGVRPAAIERAAEMASAAEDRLRRERAIGAMQGVDSRWRLLFERAIETHRRAAALQAEAVALFLHHRELRETFRREHERAPAATRTVRDAELR